MKHILPILLCFLLNITLIAQEPLKYCGTDELSFDLYRNNPQLQHVMEANRASINAFTQQYIAAHRNNRNADSVYTVPVVFHIIHMYGAENVSDSQVLGGLAVLNRNFSNQHPDTNKIPASLKPLAADCEIQFKLAHLDPNGNCTSGINRIASTFTKQGQHNVKELIHWNPSDYLNVYVVKQIPNLAGHCLMPDQAAAKPEWDGIVLANDYLGNTGTSNELRSVVMAHETGHFLNLFHIWGGNNVPGYYYLPVGQTSNCTMASDSVDDTPPTKGWSSCNLAAASCGNVVDNVQNAMDYSYCNFMFTHGQRQRMRAALNSPVANRNSLITAGNLLATGVNMTTVCKADFTVSRKTACMNDSLFFTDKSITTPDTWLWKFGDGQTSTEQNPANVYYSPGDYYVTLTASKNGTTVTSDTVRVRINTDNPKPFYIQDFETLPSFVVANFTAETDNSKLTYALSADNQGRNSFRSAVIRMADTSATYSGRTVLISPAINLSGSPAPVLSFDFAFSQKQLNNDDILELSISNDCGKTWKSQGKKIGANLRTVATAQTDMNWAPADSTEWRTFSANITGANLVSNFMFKIDLISFRGNAFYIDNININPELYDGIETLSLKNINLVPNPSFGTFKLTGDFEPMSLVMMDVNGKTVYSKENVNKEEWIDVSKLASGLYYVQLKNKNKSLTQRLAVYNR